MYQLKDNHSDFISFLTSFEGTYDPEGLLYYFETLVCLFQNSPQPIVLLLTAIDEHLTLIYEPDVEQWLLINPAEKLDEPMSFLTNKEITKQVLCSPLGTNSPTSFETKIFVVPSGEKTLRKHIEALDENERWKRLQQSWGITILLFYCKKIKRKNYPL